MQGDGFDDGAGESPDAENAAGQFGMAGVGEELGFGFPKIGVFVAREGNGFGEEAGKIGAVEELADVVEETGGEGLFGHFEAAFFLKGDLLGDAVHHRRNGSRVRPR